MPSRDLLRGATGSGPKNGGRRGGCLLLWGDARRSAGRRLGGSGLGRRRGPGPGGFPGLLAGEGLAQGGHPGRRLGGP